MQEQHCFRSSLGSLFGSLPSGHYLDVLFLLWQWSMLQLNVPGHVASVLTEPPHQAIGSVMQALQLLQLLPGHLNRGKRDTDVRGEDLSHCSPGILSSPALTFLSSRNSMSAVW